MQTEIKMPRQFVEDFECVAKHYCLAELGEYETARGAVLRDPAGAIQTFSRLAEAVRSGVA